ncbi:MAG: beta-galactosidase [Thermoguttaceae bacterium]|nr:beta-galactosidase [Thermoguttaceae bacterium]MDW8078845.1 beta-galactosidase [Thermoguttaceae bacterium]
MRVLTCLIVCSFLVCEVLCGRAVGLEEHRALPRLRVNGNRLIAPDGKVVVLWGVNYFRPGTGWAPQLWRQFDPAATAKDLQLLRSYGVNCVRVFLTFGSFFQEPDRLAEDGLRKWDAFLKLAEEAGIYVHPTGPDHWEGIPSWARRDRFADEEMLAAQERFWQLFAEHNRGRAVVVAYDLLNEPSVGWDSPALRLKWNRWLREKYGSAQAVAEAWGLSVNEIRWGDIPPPRLDGTASRSALIDYQDFRESVADEWVRRQVRVIRQADPEALVTVGLIQWSIPVVLPDPRQYSAFRPERLAQWLDFQEVHFYPLARGFFDYRRAEDWEANLAYVQAVVRECAKPGQPVVVAEFGWYGGGQLTFGNHPPAAEEDQARWCSSLVKATEGLASGWLNWGAFDHPEAKDVTQLTGLFRADGRPKAWAERFRQLGQQLAEGLPSAMDVPQIAFDWTNARVDPGVGRRFLTSYTEELRRLNVIPVREDP